jgi:transcriptional regulator with PAS, ATPase and Fis domain
MTTSATPTANMPARTPRNSGAVSADYGFQNIVGRSPAIAEALEMARRVAKTARTTVLLLGETGVGKELFARGIHYAGANSEQPFVAVNCAAIPETLLESELFGHERGAFTDARKRKAGLFELAGTGTIFLDEIHQMPLALQPKLLRVLESRRVRLLGGSEEIDIKCRLIAAANPLLEQAVATGAFREDLFYRLNVFTITLPALRERQEDITLIARQCLAESVTEHGRVKVLSPAALETLHTHRWPGNVRELRNIIERAAILSGEERTILPEHLLIQRRTDSTAGDSLGEIRFPRTGKTLAAVEREAIQIALRITNGNRSAGSRVLGSPGSYATSRSGSTGSTRDDQSRLDGTTAVQRQVEGKHAGRRASRRSAPGRRGRPARARPSALRERALSASGSLRVIDRIHGPASHWTHVPRRWGLRGRHGLSGRRASDCSGER